MVRVMIKRKVKAGEEGKLQEALKDFRSAALYQRGYITGETLVRTEDPRIFLVMSTWDSLENWNAWHENERRVQLADLLRPHLEEDEQFFVYYVVGREI
ncbi:MAG: antibiotic biosynthesis monooxygenase [Dehalococcoidia bacterium]|nr:antibiotic biosynthesis monooxygenase [Dehalococcoidia bacterium]